MRLFLEPCVDYVISKLEEFRGNCSCSKPCVENVYKATEILTKVLYTTVLAISIK